MTTLGAPMTTPVEPPSAGSPPRWPAPLHYALHSTWLTAKNFSLRDLHRRHAGDPRTSSSARPSPAAARRCRLVSAMIMVSMAAYGSLGAAMSGGSQLALERRSGWFRQLSITAWPPREFLLAKAAVIMVLVLPALLLVFAAGFAVGGVRLPVGRLARLARPDVAGPDPADHPRRRHRAVGEGRGGRRRDHLGAAAAGDARRTVAARCELMPSATQARGPRAALLLAGRARSLAVAAGHRVPVGGRGGVDGLDRRTYRCSERWDTVEPRPPASGESRQPTRRERPMWPRDPDVRRGQRSGRSFRPGYDGGCDDPTAAPARHRRTGCGAPVHGAARGAEHGLDLRVRAGLPGLRHRRRDRGRSVRAVELACGSALVRADRRRLPRHGVGGRRTLRTRWLYIGGFAGLLVGADLIWGWSLVGYGVYVAIMMATLLPWRQSRVSIIAWSGSAVAVDHPAGGGERRPIYIAVIALGIGLATGGRDGGRTGRRAGCSRRAAGRTRSAWPPSASGSVGTCTTSSVTR